MGRIPRIHFAGAVYHVMARGVDGRPIFLDDEDRVRFTNSLLHFARGVGAEILEYCLMGNHFHLAVKVAEISLAALMQRLLTGYVCSFNAKHSRTGHLFQARYKANLCTDEAYLANTLRYIRSNPVRAGLVKHASEWPWGSAAGKVGLDDSADFVGFEPWPKSTTYEVELAREKIPNATPIEVIGADVAGRLRISLDEMRSGSRRRAVVAARCEMTHAALRAGHSLRALSAWLRVSPASMTRYARHQNENNGRPDTC